MSLLFPRTHGVPSTLLTQSLPPNRRHDLALHEFYIVVNCELVALKLAFAALVEKDPSADNGRRYGYRDGEINPQARSDDRVGI